MLGQGRTHQAYPIETGCVYSMCMWTLCEETSIGTSPVPLRSLSLVLLHTPSMHAINVKQHSSSRWHDATRYNRVRDNRALQEWHRWRVSHRLTNHTVQVSAPCMHTQGVRTNNPCACSSPLSGQPYLRGPKSSYCSLDGALSRSALLPSTASISVTVRAMASGWCANSHSTHATVLLVVS